MDKKPAYLHGKGRGRGAPLLSIDSGRLRLCAQGPHPNDLGKKQTVPDHPSCANVWLASDNKNNSNVMVTDDIGKNALEEASLRHKEAARKHLKDASDDLDSDEEEDLGDTVLNTIFKSYSTNFDEVGDGENEKADVFKAQEHLLHSIRSSACACLICIENIRRQDPIWTCRGCYCVLHLQCIQKWVKEGVYQQQNQAEHTDNDTHLDLPWFCPKCRHEYKQIDCPTKSMCFCGKVEEPKFDPWLIPHACGQTCSRPLKPFCGHTCLLTCHPGSCPPCPKMVLSPCCCGKGGNKPRRCNARTWTCGKVCGKFLSCGHHPCEKNCHLGECPACEKTSRQQCCCGKAVENRPCSSPVWHCQQPCGKRLGCGNHVCEEICHCGKCGACPRTGVRKCPCGKTTYDLPCTEDIFPCGDTCGQLLQCGIHSCTQRCHFGPCGQCVQVLQKRCRCGQSQKEVLCSKEYLCEKRCNNLRDCGKHQCKRKCCDGRCPPCEQNCGKTLGCRNHKCPSRCHRGDCYPCAETKDITCFCKKTKITVPCGKEKATKPPRCNLPCNHSPNCHHPQRQKHRCHFGECPPCTLVCGVKLPGCHHTCPVRCHHAVKIQFQDKSRKEGPWDLPTTYIQTVKKDCPLCQVPMPVECMGKHEVGQFPCSKVCPYSCGRKCGRKLECGNHSCQLACHLVHGAPDSVTAGENCQVCDLGCEKPRAEGCTHKCLQPCHPGPCPPCTAMVRMRCHCGAVVKHIPCHEWLDACTDRQNSLRSCGGQCPKMMECSHQCPNMCHSGSCPAPGTCDHKVYLRCECKRKKREVQCHERRAGENLDCDNTCRKLQNQKKQAQADMKQKQGEEEARRQAADLEEFERHMKGRRKKPRKHREEMLVTTFWQIHRNTLLISLSLLLLAVFVGCLFMSH